MKGGISISAFARQLGVSTPAVSKAYKLGRFLGSVRPNAAGRPVVVDVALAMRQWAENAVHPPRNRPPIAGIAGVVGAATLLEAQRLQAIERTRQLRIANRIKLGKYVPAADVDRRWASNQSEIKTALLGYPSKAKQRLPHLSVSDVEELERLARETCEDLARMPAR